MERITWVALSVLVFFSFDVASAYQSPDPQLTPGYLCSEDDPDFSGLDYPEQIARCERDVTTEEKQSVADAYGGIPKSEWKNYEFDHLIPLCAGGSDDERNIWPQPIDEAHDKDKIEDEVCRAMRAGNMTQKQAVTRIHDWFDSHRGRPAK